MQRQQIQLKPATFRFQALIFQATRLSGSASLSSLILWFDAVNIPKFYRVMDEPAEPY
jgi:hypothetical protein